MKCSHMIRKTLSKAIKDCKTRKEAERVGLKAWLEFVLQNQYMYHIIWESLYIDRELFNEYYISFAKSYMKGLSVAEKSGELIDIDLEVLAYTLMGATNFLGLRWGLFDENTTHAEVDRVVDEFMKILDRGIFVSKELQEQEAINDSKSIEKERSTMSTRFRFQMQLDEYESERE